MPELEIQTREITGTKALKKLREDGSIPGVLYGPKEKTAPVTMSDREFKNVWKEAGESTIVTLKGLKEDKDSLIHDVDVDPITGEPRHADFYVIEKGKKVQVSVSLEFTGDAPAVKELGGALVKVLHEVEIEALPKDLPHSIYVDVSPLTDFNAQVLVKDIVIPEGVTAVTGPQEVVALVSEVVEEEEVSEEDPDLSQIEVEKKGKEEDADGGDQEESKENQKQDS
tara:strand:- start:44873 stop:45550 length:678 start_codon:yes stop_codon:yes gene_type:complete